ncbi:hybrid non-ribosomal peptide synthetase/type I polyketide synthase [Paenibacillus apiarius]|uniref:Hybrid non-ribosomal peptide synthetase/type I polyketide synthase n=1 Tax=Paenibacillus apiarius TaxID=46240 RepID=A0ABT4DLR0_9BACL|nr:hybrid non-ribosomal peptide synthetase/type I polyketide synthase [Paenibacillus apiarius]MCY9513728.1 hybrid non-ribosomal peptide synthetase/type I polyketide synthase [Paenibacillus apiarius]MCY9518279.1 hybrid non-ribosomal peptide synthetase/type I polyketide synthase [Paenibacillus apiarius]MCY9551320.1 hybrid non-ribosomal peptide synthetase/type I polyketide synthase [Paenibacillus apiarius]MCY9558474.1 hybrid non-ribosomal peptide synthetase/type I polyketide synthase [Paenibacillu
MKEPQKLDKSNVEDILALTPMQAGMLLQYLKDPDTTQYVELIELGIDGEIDKTLFEQSWACVVQANEALRVLFRWEEVNRPVQIVLKQHRPIIRYENYSNLDGETRAGQIAARIAADKKEKFKLDQVPFRLTLCKQTERKHTLLMSFHHILFDGWSTGILLKEWLTSYRMLAEGLQPKLPQKPRFKQFVSLLQQQDKKKQESYWSRYLHEVQNKPVPVSRGGSSPEKAVMAVHTEKRSGTFTADLHRFVRSEQVTQAALFYTAWGILLQHYTNSDDVLFGTTVSGRNTSISGMEHMVGLFINTLPFRMKAGPEQGLSDLLAEANRSIQASEEHAGTSLTDIKAYGRLRAEGNPFDSLVVVENYPLDKAVTSADGPLAIESHHIVEETEFDLTVRITATDELELAFAYNEQAHRADTVEKLAFHYLYIIEQIIQASTQVTAYHETRLKDIGILTAEERQQIRHFNLTTASYPREKTIHELFEEQVLLSPESTAVTDERRSHTYRELNEQANRIARALRADGMERGQVVGLMANRSTEMIAGIFGILKSGGVYLPLDSAHPAERIAYMLKDGQVRTVLASSGLEALVPKQAKVRVLDEALLDGGEAADMTPVNGPEHPAYVMYTSGSTGMPKGVMVGHRNVVRLVRNTNYVQVEAADCMLQAGAIGFDALTFEVFGALLNGASLHIADKHTLLDSARLDAFLRARAISVALLTPALFNQLAQQRPVMFARMRHLIVGGDVLSPKHIQAVRQACPGLTMWNAYGPTENTVISTCFRIDREYADHIPIGLPISNSTAYIIDRYDNLLPIGVPGELIVGGDGVALGYLNQPELTAEKFVPDLFRSRGVMYRTGDMARWQEDGSIEYMGRIDQQVKIRGHRIEIGEIETMLLQHKSIREAAVTARIRGAQTELCAYVAASEQVPASELRAHLAANLPDYMIPSHFVQLERIPLTPNGKLDRKALPAPAEPARFVQDAAMPRTELERLIAEAWKAVLELDRIGIHDKYFEVGGNSINLIQLQSKLQRQLGREVSIVTLFQYPTVHDLAAHLAGEADGTGARSDDGALASNEADPFSKVIDSPAKLGNKGVRDIAVIGMAGKFPGARNIGEFWSNLQQGKESISFFTDDELAEYGFDRSLMKRPEFVKAKGVLDEMDNFDPAFFGYTPDQAAIMDPQVRLLHECAWHALEDAGCDPERHGGSIGLFAGVTNNFHWLSQLSDRLHGNLSDMFEVDSLNDAYTVSTRISHKLNLKGPAISLQTACSTSLVAVHLACQSILSGDCDLALAGGASIVLPHKSGYLYQEGMVKSPDGHCRTFDAKAKGTIGGDGVGFVALKSLDAAVADGDRIYAVIKGSAINNDGSRKVGYTAPSVQGQANVIARALEAAQIPAESITYVEAHGSGTTLGDPIEIEALTKAFQSVTSGFCRIGSLKTNIGHLDAAAGVAGLIKTALALHHKRIPPSLHFETPNPNIDFANSPFVVNTGLTEWRNDAFPLRAGVSSFGIGGTNAHVIMEEAPALQEGREGRSSQLLVLSAQTPAALDAMTANLGAYLQEHPGVSLADIAYTLQTGRRHFKYRRMLACETAEEAIEALMPSADRESFDERKVLTFAPEDERTSVVFMFSGQGSQYVNMGAGLYRDEPIFRAEMDRCFHLYRDIAGRDMKELLYPSADAEAAALHLNQTRHIQPAMFMFEYALARLLMAWGVKPDAMIGYSFGEYAAACLAGVMSLEDAMRLIVLRGELMQQAPAGAMLSVPMAEEDIKPHLSGTLSLAVVNGPSCIVSGSLEDIAAFEQKMKADKYLCMRLPVATAGHSSMLHAVTEPFADAVRQVRLHPPDIPYVSTTTGSWITAEEAADPDYWIRHMTDTVRFADGIARLVQEPHRLFVEVGPGQDLTLLVRRHLDSGRGQQALNLVRSAQRRVSDSALLVNRIGRLWLHGQSANWKAFHGEPRAIVSLPAYPFARQRYWLEPSEAALLPAGAGMSKGRQASGRLGKQPDMSDWFYVPTWKKEEYPAAAASLNAGAPGNWLVFADDGGFAADIAKLLAERGGQVITVRAGEQFEQDGSRQYTVNPRNEQHYTKLFADLQSYGMLPDRMVHAWGVSAPLSPDGGASWIRATQELGFYSLLYMAKALKRLSAGEEVRIWVLTDNMQAIAGESVLYPEKATALGPCRVIPQELPHIQCRSIDIVLPEAGSWQRERLIRRLLDEFDASGFESSVAYRDNARWVLGYEAVKVEEPEALAPGLRQGGVYLITGGLGYIGQVLSGYLARSVQAKLVLTSRSAFPSRDQWESWLVANGAEDAVSVQIGKLRQLEAHGAEVLVLSADAANQGQVEAAIQQAEAEFGPLNGVIHAAGMTGDAAFRMLEETDETLCEQHFQAKLYGLLVLEEVLSGKELDFCLLASSLSPMLGGLGFSAYAAANHFMDAYVHDRNRRQRVPWRSVNWDGWQLEAEQTIRGQTGASISDLLIAPAEGVELLRRLLSIREVNQIVVSTGNLHERIDKWVKREEAQEERTTHRQGDGGFYSRPALSSEYIAPATETERKLCGMWEQFFRIERIGVQDDFFELGGDSLKAITVVSAIHKELQVEIGLPAFFNMPNIQQLSAYIDAAEQSSYLEIEPAERRDYYELSSAQKRLYLIQQMEQGHTGYNEIVAGVLEGPLDRERLEAVLRQLVERHESLRTSFELINGKPMQKINDTVTFEIEYEDFSAGIIRLGSDAAPPPEGEAETDARIRAAVARFVRPFDLTQAPLMRAGLIKLGEERHVLMVDLHHIVSDGLSQDIFVNDFMALYAGREVPELALQYKDFSEWQNRMMNTDAMKRQGEFWLNQLQDAAQLSLRTDYPRSETRSFAGSLVPFGLDAQRTQALKSLCLREDVTLFMALLAVFNLMLAKVCVQDDIVVGTPIVGRKQQALQLIIGKFVNMLPLRNRLQEEMSFSDLLQAVRSTTLDAFAHQDYQFEEMVQQAGRERDLGRNPIFDVVFALQNMQNPEMSIPGLTMKPFPFVHDASHFDLSLIAEEDGERLSFKFEYSTRLFQRDTIERFAAYMQDIVSDVLANPEKKLKDIAIAHHLAEPEPVFLAGAQGEFGL